MLGFAESLTQFFSASPLQLAAAVLLDLALGDPRWMPHPARVTGRLVPIFEKAFVAIFGRSRAGGLLFWLALVLALLAGAVAVSWLLASVSPPAAWGFQVFVIYQCVAARDMHRHVRAVLQPMTQSPPDLPAARKRLSWIVGRDTEDLTETEIHRAAIESVGESACDGVMAPLFWSAILGPAGGLIYRVTNTLDSMVGHRGERYGRFGMVSARVDDLMNWLPARLVALGSEAMRGFRSIRRIAGEARGHRSPNAGWGEAAIAYALGVRLGGENRYGGKVLAGPVFNAEGEPPDAGGSRRSLHWWWKIVLLSAMIALLIRCLR